VLAEHIGSLFLPLVVQVWAMNHTDLGDESPIEKGGGLEMGSVHRIENPAPATAVACKEEDTEVKVEGPAVSAPAMSPVEEVLHIKLPEGLQAPEQVKDVLLLLKVLECLNR
jgi:hypothetical protein